MRSCTHTHVHMHTHACTCTHTYTNTPQTHTHAHTQPPPPTHINPCPPHDPTNTHPNGGQLDDRHPPPAPAPVWLSAWSADRWWPERWSAPPWPSCTAGCPPPSPPARCPAHWSPSVWIYQQGASFSLAPSDGTCTQFELPASGQLQYSTFWLNGSSLNWYMRPASVGHLLTRQTQFELPTRGQLH